MFAITIPETDPRIIYPNKRVYETRVKLGQFYRVFPSSCREVSALRLIEHHVDKFAPADGNGVYITHAAMEKFMNRKTLSPIE